MSSIKLIKAYLYVTRLAFPYFASAQFNQLTTTTSIIMNRLLKPDRLDLDPKLSYSRERMEALVPNI